MTPFQCKWPRVLLLGLALWPMAVPAQGDMLVGEYDDIGLFALSPPEGKTFPVRIVGPREGINTIIEAIDLIKKESPYSAAQIKTLKKNGAVFLIYDPSIPEGKGIVSLLFAIFSPNYFGPDEIDESETTFNVLIGRHIIKRPLKELAAVLVHELVGHGLQHLEGRMGIMRRGDLECEARLYEEKSNQDFGVDRRATKMIKFRQQLKRSCILFRRYLRKEDKAGHALWKKGKLEVPRLLDHFRKYVDDLRARGVMQDALQRVMAYQQADRDKIFDGGAPHEQHVIGLTFLKGSASLGAKPDPAEAAKWFRRAAEQGYTDAHAELGALYEKGRGVARDDAEAARCYRIAADGGNARAQYALGILYETGRGVPRDDGEAAAWFGKAATGMNTASMVTLASFFETGLAFEKNQAKALKLYRKAARLGDPEAQFKLAYIHLKGRGVPRNEDKAFKWFRRAAERGIAEAQNSLGAMYARGMGTPRDAVKAHMWLSLAAKKGVEGAGERRDKLAGMMTADQLSRARRLAMEWKPKTP